VFFLDNAVAAGVPVEHIHGQISNIHGFSDGRSLEFAGAVALDSFIVAGQQVSNFESPLVVGRDGAALTSIQARLLGGIVRGDVRATLDATPEYRANLRIEGADLARYAQTLPGRQEIAGKVSGRLELTGAGSDPRRLNGSGDAHLSEGELGKLPIVLQLIRPLNLSRETKAAFDSADLAFTVEDGQVHLRHIKVTGDTISLAGSGTLDPQGEVDLVFKPLYGRDERLHVPGLSDATREFGGQVFVITAKGPLASPRIGLTPFPSITPRAAGLVRGMGNRDPRVNRARK
jgi:hypothetical protein